LQGLSAGPEVWFTVGKTRHSSAPLRSGATVVDLLVRAHRLRLGLTQEELARRSGVGLRTIRDLEAGRVRKPRPVTVRLLSDAFGLQGVQRDEFCANALIDKALPNDRVLAEVLTQLTAVQTPQLSDAAL
jgi:transcriptional regulator with XRE-family HTH domain